MPTALANLLTSSQLSRTMEPLLLRIAAGVENTGPDQQLEFDWFAVEGVIPMLLRDVVTGANPPTPSLATVLPLRAPEDRYRSPFAPGETVPDPLEPLAFYALATNDVVFLTKAGTEIRIEY